MVDPATTYVAAGAGALGVYEVILRPVGRQVKDALYSNPPEQSGGDA